MPEPEPSTREKLIDAAARLFAERGIEAVSLAEIVRVSGQRNTSAVQYHFGGRDDLLLAILEQYVPVIRDRRLELLAIAEADGADRRLAAEALVRPVTELAQRGWRERAYLQIGVELTTGPDRASPRIQAALAETAGAEVFELLAQRLPAQPSRVQRERFGIVSLFVGRAAADRARLLGSRVRKDEPFLSEEEFVANLVDMVVGALTSPPTPVESRREAS